MSFLFLLGRYRDCVQLGQQRLLDRKSVVSVQFPFLPLEGCCGKFHLAEIRWSCCDGAILLGPLSNIRIPLRCTSVSPTLRPWRKGKTSTVSTVRIVGITVVVVRSSCGLFGVLVSSVGRLMHISEEGCALERLALEGLCSNPMLIACLMVLMSTWTARRYLEGHVFFDAKRVFACRS